MKGFRIAKEEIWPDITAHSGETFHTTGRGRITGKPFTYYIRGGEMFISTKAKSITKATVMIACRKAIEIQKAEGYVSGPKQLGTFGASYLYPVFLKLGIITRKPAGLLTTTAGDMTNPEINPAIDLLTHSSDDIIMESHNNAKECANMPRPKGSKNKKTTVMIEVDTIANIDEKIAAAEAAVAELTENLKTKKVELRELTKAKAEAEKAAAEKKAEEEKAKLLEAVAASGKSIDEIIEMINQ